MKTLSYHNDKKLKDDMVKEMLHHQKADALIKGTYSRMNGIFRGCAVGCGVQSLNLKRGLTIKHDDHAEYAKALGVPEWLARLEDTLFENLPEKESKEFPVKLLKVIPVGVNLESVKWKFSAFILKENIERVLLLKIEDKLKEQVVNAIKGVLNLHEKAVETGKWDESAAESAWSAAESAESAARSAAYLRYADELIKLLKKQK